MNENRGLWRGKSVDNNGEWVLGDLSRLNGQYFITDPIYRWSWRVDPETLGECTGLTDKNGKKIFEGDVLSNKLPDPELFLCYYCDEDAGFYAKNMRTHSVYMLGALMDMTLFKLEIIGNIHDNPELMNATGEDIGNAAQDTLAPAT